MNVEVDTSVGRSSGAPTYGFQIEVNVESGRTYSLFLSIFYFDNSDFSISKWFKSCFVGPSDGKENSAVLSKPGNHNTNYDDRL